MSDKKKGKPPPPLKMRPRYYIQLPEKDSSEVSPIWKMAHFILFLVTAIAACIQSWGVSNMLDTYNYRCILGAKIEFRDFSPKPKNTSKNETVPSYQPQDNDTISQTLDNSDNDTKYVLEVDKAGNLTPDFRLTIAHNNRTIISELRIRKTVFASTIMCDFVLMAPLISMILGFVFGTMFYLYPKGGGFKRHHTLTQPWHLMFPLILISGFMVIMLSLSSGIWIHGLQTYCNGWKRFTGTGKCTNLMDAFTIQFNDVERPFYTYYVVGTVGSQASIFLWGLQIGLVILRIVALADFSMVITRIHEKEKTKQTGDDEEDSFGLVVESLMKARGHAVRSSALPEKPLVLKHRLTPKLNALKALGVLGKKSTDSVGVPARESKTEREHPPPVIIDIPDSAKSSPEPSPHLSEMPALSARPSKSILRKSEQRIPDQRASLKVSYSHMDFKSPDMDAVGSQTPQDPNIPGTGIPAPGIPPLKSGYRPPPGATPKTAAQQPDSDQAGATKPQNGTTRQQSDDSDVQHENMLKANRGPGQVDLLKPDDQTPKTKPGGIDQTPSPQPSLPQQSSQTPDTAQPSDVGTIPPSNISPKEDGKTQKSAPTVMAPTDDKPEAQKPPSSDDQSAVPPTTDATQKPAPKEDTAPKKTGAIPKRPRVAPQPAPDDEEQRLQARGKEAPPQKEPDQTDAGQKRKEPTDTGGKPKPKKKKEVEESTPETSRPEASTETEPPVSAGTSTNEDTQTGQDSATQSTRKGGKDKTFPKVFFY